MLHSKLYAISTNFALFMYLFEYILCTWNYCLEHHMFSFKHCVFNVPSMAALFLAKYVMLFGLSQTLLRYVCLLLHCKQPRMDYKFVSLASTSFHIIVSQVIFILLLLNCMWICHWTLTFLMYGLGLLIHFCSAAMLFFW